jgi:hypothetical protein
MRDLLPQEVMVRLRDRYVTGIADALATFDDNYADEDSLTGALAQAIATPRPIRTLTDQGEYIVKLGYTKVRGRGPAAPESIFGTDGAFQIEVHDSTGHLVRRKALPFQAKKEWKGTKPDVVAQAKMMIDETYGGIVIDFNRKEYVACTAETAVQAKGKRGIVEAMGGFEPLSKVLGTYFLECKVGTIGQFFDPEMEAFHLQVLPYRTDRD